MCAQAFCWVLCYALMGLCMSATCMVACCGCHVMAGPGRHATHTHIHIFTDCASGSCNKDHHSSRRQERSWLAPPTSYTLPLLAMAVRISIFNFFTYQGSCVLQGSTAAGLLPVCCGV